MKDFDRKPGWDKKVVNRIATEQYDGLANMFKEHGWTKGEKTYGQIAPTHVKQTYGSVDAFERAHLRGLDENSLYNPIAAIRSDPPNVWLTSYYGFDPEEWGLLAFGSETDRANFLAKSAPGALIVVYAAKSVGAGLGGKVLGVQQVSHTIGPSKQFIAPCSWKIKQEGGNRDRWLYGVQSTRAWKIAPEDQPNIEEFANETWSPAQARAIGRYCMQVTSAEARKILDLELYETSVYRGRQIEAPEFAKGKELMKPSRPGPVSQSGFQVSESEGPKHLYMLQLNGQKLGAFVDGKLKGRSIVKVGFSKSPEVRCHCFNRALPGQEFAWTVAKSTAAEGQDAFPTSNHAKAGEQEMVRYLNKHSQSLGGEFFLAEEKLLSKAWKKGKAKAGEFKS